MFSTLGAFDLRDSTNVPQSGSDYRLIYRGNIWQDLGDTVPSIMLGR